MADPIQMTYARIRAREAAERRARIQRAYALAPRLQELDGLRTRLVMEAGQRKLTPEKSRAALLAISEEEQQILAGLGLKPDELELHYQCSVCRDTGFVGEIQRTPCACRLRYQQAALSGEGVNDRETFENFSESIYPDSVQRARAIKVKTFCLAYANSLPGAEKPNLLLMGMPGLGKTYLGNAIAFFAINRGIDSLRATAYRFVQDMLADIRDRSGRAVRYQTVPFLVLDDLGSEPDIPNVTREWLFAILNERTQARRPTVCITNLTLPQLMERYGERIMSRMADQGTTSAIQLTGSNLRLEGNRS